jgi:hypothetical protein
MTLIVTVIRDFGMLQAADSNVTNRDSAGRDSAGGTGKKVYELGFCPGAVALAGSYLIQGVRMNLWMPRAISDYASGPSPDLEGFARYLGARLAAEGTPGDTGLLIHVAGYASDAQGSHPEMWLVRNYQGIDGTTGEYIGLSHTYEISEDFWQRDYPKHCAGRDTLGQSYGYRYFNGLPEGRINYLGLSQTLNSFLERDVWAQPNWRFHPPRDLSELALFMGLELRLIGALFTVSDYPPYVGGDPQVVIIQPPGDTVPL